MTHERCLDDARGMQFAANLDLHTGGGCFWHARQRDGTIQGRRKCSARHFAGGNHSLLAAQHPTPFQQPAPELTSRRAPPKFPPPPPPQNTRPPFQSPPPAPPPPPPLI